MAHSASIVECDNRTTKKWSVLDRGLRGLYSMRSGARAKKLSMSSRRNALLDPSACKHNVTSFNVVSCCLWCL